MFQIWLQHVQPGEICYQQRRMRPYISVAHPYVSTQNRHTAVRQRAYGLATWRSRGLRHWHRENEATATLTRQSRETGLLDPGSCRYICTRWKVLTRCPQRQLCRCRPGCGAVIAPQPSSPQRGCEGGLSMRQARHWRVQTDGRSWRHAAEPSLITVSILAGPTLPRVPVRTVAEDGGK